MLRSPVLWLLPLALFAAACAPTAREVPAAEPVFYAAQPLAVMGSVIEAISTAPGLDDSTGWMITDSDTQGGFIRAETEVTTSPGLFQRASTRMEWVSVVVTAAGENRSQVVIQHTGGAISLATRVRAALQSAYGLN
jgi:hypothetical protein